MLNNQSLLQDPIILVAGIVVLAALAILVWAFKTLKTSQDQFKEELSYNEQENEPDEVPETQGIEEARIAEMCSQLSTISRKLEEIEKSIIDIKEKKTFDETVPAGSLNIQGPGPELEKLFAKIDSRLEQLSGEKQNKTDASAPDIDRIEMKLDSIRKLLVLLTESGNPNE
jgi:hypothetical protein